MSQANVYTSASNAAIYTDKVKISTGNTAVSYNVYVLWPNDIGNLYSANPTIPADSSRDIFVGVENRLTVLGANVTITELGTASSGNASVIAR
jgi:hypothetical protein